MMDHTGIAQIMYEPPKSDGSTCTLMAASLRLDVKHNLDEQELYSELWAHDAISLRPKPNSKVTIQSAQNFPSSSSISDFF